MKTETERLVERWEKARKMTNEEKYPPYLLTCKRNCCRDARRELNIKEAKMSDMSKELDKKKKDNGKK